MSAIFENDTLPVRAGKVVVPETEESESCAARNRRSYSARFKARLVLEVLSERRSLTAIARENGLPKETLASWKFEMLKRLPVIFDDFMLKHQKTRREVELEQEVADLRLRLQWMRTRRKMGM